MKPAAVIINWNSGPFLARCLQSVTPALNEVVVVDNASSDDSVAQAAGFAGRVQFIGSESNRGFAAGVNQGFSSTTAPYVLVLNPDVEAVEGAVEKLTRFLDDHPRAGAVGGYLNDRYLPRRLATPWTVILENFGGRPRLSAGSGTAVEQAAAAALMIRRVAYEEVGGFDESFYPAWYEDVDFCRRLRAANWEIHFDAGARFAHEGGYTAKILGPSAFAAAFYRNQLRYIHKHFGAGAALAVRGSLVMGMLGRIVAGPGSARAYFKVIAGALGGW